MEIASVPNGETIAKLMEERSQLMKRVEELEAAIRSHRDRFPYPNPDYEDYLLWKVIGESL